MSDTKWLREMLDLVDWAKSNGLDADISINGGGRTAIFKINGVRVESRKDHGWVVGGALHLSFLDVISSERARLFDKMLRCEELIRLLEEN